MNGLTPEESDCLNQNDGALFKRGACHILAVALEMDGRWAPCQLMRVDVHQVGGPWDEVRKFGAYHVYSQRSCVVLDINGKLSEKAFRDYFVERVNADLGGFGIIKGHLPVTAKDLLAHHHQSSKPGGAWKNEWDLFTGDRFVEGAMTKAKRVILCWVKAGVLP
jgi:hypothetical protein